MVHPVCNTNICALPCFFLSGFTWCVHHLCAHYHQMPQWTFLTVNEACTMPLFEQLWKHLWKTVMKTPVKNTNAKKKIWYNILVNQVVRAVVEPNSIYAQIFISGLKINATILRDIWWTILPYHWASFWKCQKTVMHHALSGIENLLDFVHFS